MPPHQSWRSSRVAVAAGAEARARRCGCCGGVLHSFRRSFAFFCVCRREDAVGFDFDVRLETGAVVLFSGGAISSRPFAVLSVGAVGS